MTLLQKEPKFAVSTFQPVADYITATKQICASVDENKLFRKETDCREAYVKVKDILSKIVAKPKLIHQNITMEFPDTDGSIPFLDTKSLPNKDSKIFLA